MYHTCLRVTCDPSFNELLIAELAEAGFDTFLEHDDGIEAYAEGESFDRAAAEEIREKYAATTAISFAYSQVPRKNWNEEWEKSFEPIVVDNRCVIRADFHSLSQSYPYEIIITPKMSFGTGHHQTTWLMIKAMLDLPHRGKKVMDAGCGTAILSILASKLGAAEVDAFDIDDWSVENGNENKTINGCPDIRIQKGKISEVSLHPPYDIILANINKNVLLDEMSAYASHLKAGGHLLLSGFFSTDIPDLLDKAFPLQLNEVARDQRDQWASLLLRRS